MIDEKRIADTMKKLDLTREEVLEMFADDAKVDKGADLNPLTPEQEAVARKMRQADRKPTLYKWDTKKRERKPNATKEGIVAEIAKFLTENSDFETKNVEITNKNREITFNVGDDTFTWTLVQKRKPKT